MHKAGFVSIIGNPNAGKSTLMNALLEEELSITSPKAQTTREKVLGILNGENYQIVFSDTPGILNPHYKLQESMLKSIENSLDDADMFILITDVGEDFKNPEFIARIQKTKLPILLLVNKIDTVTQEEAMRKISYWQEKLPEAEVIPVSALHKFQTRKVLDLILQHLPQNPPYFPKDELSDRNLRFFAAETVRKHILLQYQQEIPYSVQVEIESYKEMPKLDRIEAVIYVEKESQKGILIGKGGSALKRVGTEARKEFEKFLGKKIFLDLRVKVLKNWRNDDRMLQRFGYDLSKRNPRQNDRAADPAADAEAALMAEMQKLQQSGNEEKQ
ncbi:MAG: GTPase Era [Bacteroidales bacterium]|nr:GTPase Era [Bacteroidales bacterium]MDE7071957.1 GTPase Era [Bacteroidales bacterium]